MREILSLALLAVACGTAMRGSHDAARSAQPTRTTTPGSHTADSTSAQAFATLAARGAQVARGMREVTRAESTGDKVEVARAAGRDACVRVVFAASAPVIAKLLDSEENVLAASDVPTTEGLLGAHGPVCVRKGDAVSAVAEGPRTTVRWIAWESP